MKRLIDLASRLYPVTWRRRYGTEFQALLEDVSPGWRELFDVLGGALKMQLSTGATYLKLGVAFAIAGVLVATVASFVIPKEYTSTAVLRLTNAQNLAKVERQVLSRNSLSQLIQDPLLDLYPSERRTQPLEDVIEYMRTRAIHISVLSTKGQSAAVAVSFRYPGERRKARAVVGALITRLVDALEQGDAKQNLEILDPPSLPQFPTSPKRPEMLVTGLTVGLLLGLLTAVFVRHPRRSLVFATLGLTGCLLGGAFSLLLPNRYISRSVIQVVPYDHDFEQALNRLGRPGLGIHVIHLSGTPGAAAVEVTVQDTDPKKAQAMVSSITASLIAESKVRQADIEYLDLPNYPASPAGPNRTIISLLGLCLGLITASVFLLLQNRRQVTNTVS
jgi:LPS O-antigen subunit length determinant protein (WzzB/FepE family)